MEDNRATLVKGALLLALAGLISKMLSAGYRIPLQNLTGDAGFYIYQEVYPILGMATIFGLYGFPSAVSQITAQQKKRGKSLSLAHFYLPIFSGLALLNGGLCLLLYDNADTLAHWIGDPNLEKIYKYAALVFLLVPFTALLRGVFQGVGNMKPTAFSQMGEQLVRVTIIILAAIAVAYGGKSAYTIGLAGALASIAGSCVALVVLGVYFCKHRPVDRSRSNAIPWTYYLRMLVMFGFVSALNHMVLIVMQLADALTLLPGLLNKGFSLQQAMVEKGVFDRGQPLIQFGSVVGSSFALALVPALSGKRLDDYYAPVERALAMSFYLSAGATLGLVMIFRETNVLLFQTDDGTATLRILAVAIMLSSVAITSASILQSLGYAIRTACLIALAFVSKWLLNLWLVPLWGIMGGAVASVLSLALLSLFVLLVLKRFFPNLRYSRYIRWRAFFAAAGGMVICLFSAEWLGLCIGLSSRLGLLVYVLLTVAIGAAVYILLLLRLGAFSEKELAVLPFSRFLIRLQKGERTRGLYD